MILIIIDALRPHRTSRYISRSDRQEGKKHLFYLGVTYLLGDVKTPSRSRAFRNSRLLWLLSRDYVVKAVARAEPDTPLFRTTPPPLAGVSTK